MTTLITDPLLEERLLAERRARRADRFDEVWDGVYLIPPHANNEHQKLVTRLSSVLLASLSNTPGAEVYCGLNVSDRVDDVTENYRCPDVAVVLPGSRAKDIGPCMVGGPDFVVEITSDYDRSRDKFDFYSGVGVRELLLIDRSPWQLELHLLERDELALAGICLPGDGNALHSQALGLTFYLESISTGRPQVVVKSTSGTSWLI